MRNHQRFCLLLMTAAMGCASAFQPLERQSDFAQYFTLRLADRTEQAKLQGARLFGAEIELQRLSDGYRGQVRGGLVDLRSGGGKIFGSVAAALTDLHVEGLADEIFISGLYAGRLGELTVAPERIKGTIGACSYDLGRHPDQTWYVGQRSCLGQITSAQLAVPAALAARRPDERALLLAVFLGS